MKKVLSLIMVFVLIFSMIPLSPITAYAIDSKVESAIAWAIAIANDDTYGYIYGAKGPIDYDCSGFVCAAFRSAGFSVKQVGTSGMSKEFQNAGFTLYERGSVTIQRGDILLKPGSHVEIYLGDNKCVGAHDNYDDKSGDTGNGKKAGQEIRVATRGSECTACSKYTYVLRYEASSSNTYTYSFNFNANGGALGSSGAFSVKYGEQFQILNTTCTRSGYTWGGWNVKRNNDNKWYVDGQGWRSESEISSNGYVKKLYPNYKTVTLDNSWIGGITGNGSYTFYAVWYKTRDSKVKAFFSPYGKGSDHITAMNASSSSGYTQNYVYAWYVLYDKNTGDLFNTYTDLNYNVCMRITKPNGESYEDTNYQNADANWVGFTPVMSGEYTITITVTGGASGSYSTTYNVYYDTQVYSSLDSISLNLNGTNSKNTDIEILGNYPGKYGVRYKFSDSSIASATWSGEWDGNSTYLTVTGKEYGSTNLTVYVYENYTGNKNDVAKITIPVKVTANTYIISYDANGGSGAPPSQTKYYGTDLTLSSTKPTGKSYTVKFDGNGGTVAKSSQTYTQTFQNWNTKADGTGTNYWLSGNYSSNASVTLYAQWNDPTLNIANPTRANYYFLGWYDSKETNSHGLPTGKRYTTGTPITQNITLYAMWGARVDLTVFWGDYNFDGAITPIDVTGINAIALDKVSYTDEDLFRCDVNADGKVDQDDATMVNDVRDGIPNMYTMPCYLYYDRIVVKKAPNKTTYQYGEDFNISGLVLEAQYSNGTTHTLSNGYIVTGYDPYKIGKQQLTVNYYFDSTTLTVTVEAPKYTLYYDANGGQVSTNNKTVTYNSSIGTLPIPTRAGYTFLGWSYSQNGTNYVTSSTVYSYMSNKTLYAQWERTSYTVSYNANGGSGVPTSQTKTHNVDLALSSIQPTRTGYKFLGWATNSTDTTAIYQPNGNYVENADVTLFAVWEVNTYTVSYDANGGSGAPTSQIKNHNVDLTLSSVEPTRVGYNFMGWATNSSATLSSYQSGTTFTSNANTTLYAVWQANTYTIRYNANGGSGSMSSSTHTYDVSKSLSSNGFNRSGYTFLGWATSSSATTATYTNGQSVKNLTSTNGATIDLYAVWSKIPTYTISYNANGGTGAPADQIKTKDVNLTLCSTTPTRPGYTFKGWATSSSATTATYQPGAAYTPNINATLYAVWQANTYTIRYNANGGSGSMSSSTHTYDVSKSLSSNGFNRSGYTFLGWATSSSATTATYTNGQSVKNLTSTNGATVELYAVWQLDELDTLLGDVNSDGTVDAGDAVLISRYDAGFITLTAAQLEAGDVNGDGVVDAGDAVVISRYDAGFISSLN